MWPWARQVWCPRYNPRRPSVRRLVLSPQKALLFLPIDRKYPRQSEDASLFFSRCGSSSRLIESRAKSASRSLGWRAAIYLVVERRLRPLLRVTFISWRLSPALDYKTDATLRQPTQGSDAGCNGSRGSAVGTMWSNHCLVQGWDWSRPHEELMRYAIYREIANPSSQPIINGRIGGRDERK